MWSSHLSLLAHRAMRGSDETLLSMHHITTNCSTVTLSLATRFCRGLLHARLHLWVWVYRGLRMGFRANPPPWWLHQALIHLRSKSQRGLQPLCLQQVTRAIFFIKCLHSVISLYRCICNKIIFSITGLTSTWVETTAPPTLNTMSI